MVCYEGGSFETAEGHKNLVVVDSLDPDDVLVYGTSDCTINPAELFMTAITAERFGLQKWIFFNYPIGNGWRDFDVNRVFDPYGFPYNGNLRDAIEDCNLGEVVDRMDFLPFQEMFKNGNGFLDMTLEEVVEMVKAVRKIRAFRVLNLLGEKPVYGSKKDKRYLRNYKFKTIRELLALNQKIGGALIYFIYGYYIAQNDLVGLMPHNMKGDVWNSFARGAKLAGGQARLFPIGGIDFMTTRQWEMWRETRQWKKAPVTVVAKLQDNPFREELERALLDEKVYCPVAYDDEQGFYLENL